MKRYIVWPQYLDCSLPRRLGRRLPKDLCIDKPSLRELLEACSKIASACFIEEEKYPRVWYYPESGRLVVEFDGKKSEFLKELAREIKSMRSQGIK